QALGLVNTYYEEFEQIGNKLVNQVFTTADFERFLEKLVPMPQKDSTDRKVANVMEVRGHIGGIWRSADNLGNIRNTKWAALQAVAEYADFGRPLRGKDDLAEKAWRRAMDDGTGLKRKALALVSA